MHPAPDYFDYPRRTEVTEQTKTATFVSETTNEVGAAQRTYKVSPPVQWTEWRDGESVVAGMSDFIVVSAADVMFSGPETYIFPGDESGEVLDWREMDGSFQGARDHGRALLGAGYNILSVSEPSNA